MDCLLCRLRAIPIPEGTNVEDLGVSLIAAASIEHGRATLCYDHVQKVRQAMAEARRRNGPRIVVEGGMAPQDMIDLFSRKLVT